MENIRVENMWPARLKNAGWSEEASQIAPLALAKSTRNNYNKSMQRLAKYCAEKGSIFPPKDTAILSGFLYELASTSKRPKSIIATALAASSLAFEIFRMPNIGQSQAISRLKYALIKTQTQQPRVHTPILPTAKFRELFHKWPDNDIISIHQLRVKTLTLLALAVMLRPSDMAPKAETRNDAGIIDQMKFKCSQLRQESNGTLTIWLHGIKNDTKRDGFQVNIPPASDPIMDPIQTLWTYIQRTDNIRPHDRPVFLSLNKPHKAIGSATIAKDLEVAIVWAGIDSETFSAKCFRPTGATLAIRAGVDPDQVRSIGRWKCRETFEEHYVYPSVRKTFTDNILGI